MPIQNARTKATLKKAQETMNQTTPPTEVTMPANGNGVHDMIETSPSAPEGIPSAPEPAKVSLETAMLKERLEKMQQGLNTLKAEQDMLEKRLTETSDNILRTEGALVMLGSIIETAGGGAGNGN